MNGMPFGVCASAQSSISCRRERADGASLDASLDVRRDRSDEVERWIDGALLRERWLERETRMKASKAVRVGGFVRKRAL